MGNDGKLELLPGDAVLIHAGEPNDIGAAEAAGEGHIVAIRSTLSALLSRTWSHVVYLSSAVVYGDDVAQPRRPEEPVAPRGAYARAKVACEQDVLAAGGTVARLSNLYGRGMAANNVISDVLAQIPGEGPLNVRDAAPIRDYLWVGDAARALAACARSRPSGVLNVGSGEGISVGALARMALDVADQSQRRIVATEPAGRASHLVLDISATRNRLGWAPRVTLRQGLGQLMRKAA